MCMLTVIHHNMDVGMSDVGGLFLYWWWLCYFVSGCAGSKGNGVSDVCGCVSTRGVY